MTYAPELSRGLFAVIRCPNCGESYLTSETLHEIERIKANRRRFASKRSVPVAKYA